MVKNKFVKEEKIKRKVVCIFGNFDEKSDFVLEPVCNDVCEFDECKNAFWIEKVEVLK